MESDQNKDQIAAIHRAENGVFVVDYQTTENLQTSHMLAARDQMADMIAPGARVQMVMDVSKVRFFFINPAELRRNVRDFRISHIGMVIDQSQFYVLERIAETIDHEADIKTFDSLAPAITWAGEKRNESGNEEY